MIAVDTNVLVYAHRAEMPLHGLALKELTALAEADLPWALPLFCIGEFVRVVTHPRIFNPCTSLEVALEYLAHLFQSPGVRLLTPGARFPTLFAESCRAAGAKGNLVFDAQIVAVCHEHGVGTVLTEDRDFARFEGISAQRLATRE